MVVNYYNFLDYALNEAWEPDQQSKPDNDYSYVDADGFGARFHRQPWNPFNIKKSRLPR